MVLQARPIPLFTVDRMGSSRRLAGIGAEASIAPANSYASRNIGRGIGRHLAGTGFGTGTLSLKSGKGGSSVYGPREGDAAARKDAALALLKTLAAAQQNSGDAPVIKATLGALRRPATSTIAKAIAAYNKALGVPASARPNTGLGLLRDDERYLFDRDRSPLSRTGFTF